MRYELSGEWFSRVRGIVSVLGFSHVNLGRVVVLKSHGTKTRRTIARIHALGRAMQAAMREEPFYAIELISERFDKLSPEEQTKTLIHELMHIPHSFGGGFRHHRLHVNREAVDRHYSIYLSRVQENFQEKSFI